MEMFAENVTKQWMGNGNYCLCNTYKPCDCISDFKFTNDAHFNI